MKITNQYFIAMKLTVLFLMLAIFQVRATGTAQTVNLTVKATSLKVVMKEVKKQTEVGS